ncbi:phospholipase DDHD1-like isoform X2 [Lycorma delicatula]|uniref:phospholipase DDHD1-like isoform X2 n=1 Tax=Lycorma delicatula TaxID=130591 RepID=UPI003F511ED9
MFKLSSSFSGKTATNSNDEVKNDSGVIDDSNGIDLSSDDIEQSASSFSKSRLINPEWSDQHTDSKSSDDPVDELNPESVRWFYKNFSDKQWTEFNGYDSLRIEEKYRKLTDIELKIFSNCVRNLKPNNDRSANSSPVPFDSPKKSVKLESTYRSIQGPELSPCSDVEERVVVRGGLYEVDVLQRTCASIFWPGEESVITRGTWFYETNWQPLDLETCETLDRAHMTLFRGKRNSEYVVDTKSPKNALHTEMFVDYNVDWYAPHEVYLYSKATPTKIVRSFTQKLGGYFQKSTGSKLLRGYKEIATDIDRPRDITHLVFVVHGIGQKMDIGGRILHNTSLIRQTVASLQEKFFPMSTERAEFFPVEWRMSLTLDGGLVEAITPMNVVPLRNFLNSSAMDIMYYTSPIYSAEIQQGVINELNRLYSLFIERNPNTNTKVSVVAHSLGCVIVYDIITGWLPQGSHIDQNTAARRDTDVISGKSRLKFNVDNFFCLGSPLSVFLALRFPRGQHGYHLFPPSLCNRLYNIFHLSDPVAYRLEPLVVREYCKIAPLQIRAHNALQRTPYSEMPLELIVQQDKEKDTSAGSTPAPTPKDESSVSPTDTPIRERGWSIWSLVRGHKNQEGTSSPQQMDSPTQGLEHRLDYVLRSSSVGISYWSAMTSHTGYWSNPDVAYFILTQIFPDLEENIELCGANCSSNTYNSVSANSNNSGGPNISGVNNLPTNSTTNLSNTSSNNVISPTDDDKFNKIDMSA